MDKINQFMKNKRSLFFVFLPVAHISYLFFAFLTLNPKPKYEKKRLWVPFVILVSAFVVYCYIPQRNEWLVHYAVLCTFSYWQWKKGVCYGYGELTQKSWKRLVFMLSLIFIFILGSVVMQYPMASKKNKEKIESHVQVIIAKDWAAWSTMLHPDCDSEIKDPEVFAAKLEKGDGFPSGEIEEIIITGYDFNGPNREKKTDLTARVVIGGTIYFVTESFLENAEGSGILSFSITGSII